MRYRAFFLAGLALLPAFPALAYVSGTDTDGVTSGYTIVSSGTSITIDTPVHNNTIYGLKITDNGGGNPIECYPDVNPQAPCTYNLATSPWSGYTSSEIRFQRNGAQAFGDDLVVNNNCGAGAEVVFLAQGDSGCATPPTSGGGSASSSATSTDYILRGVGFELGIIIVMLGLMVIGFMYNMMSTRKPWR